MRDSGLRDISELLSPLGAIIQKYNVMIKTHCISELLLICSLLNYVYDIIKGGNNSRGDNNSEISLDVIVRKNSLSLCCAQRYLRSPAQSPFGVLLLLLLLLHGISESYRVDNHRGNSCLYPSGYFYCKFKVKKKH